MNELSADIPLHRSLTRSGRVFFIHHSVAYDLSLVCLYSAADVTAAPSRQENLANMGMKRSRAAILMTSFNRRDLTLRSIVALSDAAAGVLDYEVFIVDDRSTDGTAAALAALGPHVHVIEGTGHLYWNGGMREHADACL